jgi:hypothetical protein
VKAGGIQLDPTFGRRCVGYGDGMTRLDIRNQSGAVGWLLIGILIGIFLVFYAFFALIF